MGCPHWTKCVGVEERDHELNLSGQVLMLISILQSKCVGEQTNRFWLLRSKKGGLMRNWVCPEE